VWEWKGKGGKQMREIVVYSKKNGVNRLLPIHTDSDLVTLARFVEETSPDEKDFVYALVDGVEIKLF